MKMDVTSVGSCQKQVQFNIPPDEVRKELSQAYKQLGRRVRLPGFRPGKAPRKVLEMRFGSQVNSDVAATLIQRGYSDAIEQDLIEPVGRPEVDQGELDPSAGFDFSITVDVRPDIELEAYTGLEVAYPEIEVADEEIEAQVEAHLEGESRLVEVTDRAAEQGDMVLVELTATDGDDEVVTEPGTMIRTGGDPYYPGVDELVVGLSTGDEATETIAFPDDAKIDAVAGRELAVTVKVQSIQANEIPELTDELAEELGYEGGAQGMRLAIKAEIEQAREEAARNQARANALQAMIDANAFDVPQSMIDQQLEALVEELRLQAVYRGQDPKSVTFNDAQMADLRVRAEFAVKGGLILEYVADRETIEVDDSDLEAKYQELADERGQPVEAIKGYFQRDDMVDELRERLLEEKTLDWLLEHSELVAPSEAPIAPAEPTVADLAGEAVAEEPAAAEAAAEEGSAVDLSILDGTVGDVKSALETGEYDDHLDALLAAEQGGKDRKGVQKAIEGRRA